MTEPSIAERPFVATPEELRAWRRVIAHNYALLVVVALASRGRDGGSESGITREDVRELIGTVHEGKEAILYSSACSLRDISEQTKTLAVANTKSSREIGTAMASATEVRTRM